MCSPTSATRSRPRPTRGSRRSRSPVRRSATPSARRRSSRSPRAHGGRPRGHLDRRDRAHRRGSRTPSAPAATSACGGTPATCTRTRPAAPGSGASTSPTCTSRSAGCPSRWWRWSPATRSAAATCWRSSATSRSPPTTPASARSARGWAPSTAASGRGCWRTSVGPKRAREIWFLCRQYSAEQAYEMGLVNTVVPLERLEEETLAWCREMLALSPFALRLLKASFNAAEDGLAGIQQLAHDANLLFYEQRGGPGGSRRVPREAQAGLLALPQAGLASWRPPASGSWRRGCGRCRPRSRRCSSAPRWPSARVTSKRSPSWRRCWGRCSSRSAPTCPTTTPTPAGEPTPRTASGPCA